MRPRRLGRVLSVATIACAIVVCFAPAASQAATPVQQAYAKASNTAPDDQFGVSVAISGDTMVIGAPLEDSTATGIGGDGSNDDAPNSGAAYVFTRDAAGTWTQQAYLKASNTGAEDRFGYSVAISGETIVVGAYGEASSATGVGGDQGNEDAVYSGAAYVFTREDGTWTQQDYLKASNTGASDTFGFSVGISGETIVIGAYAEDSSATGVGGNQALNSASSSGAAYVFTRNVGTWTQQAYLKASNTGADDQFGYSVAISGEVIVVGAFAESSNATGVGGDQANDGAGASGAAYVFAPKATTQTVLSCAPDTRQIGEASTCTAQVTGSNPTGTVSFNADGAGGLDITSCSLAAGSCSVAYTPSGVGDGTHTVTASYQGDGANEASSGTDDVTVTKATTAMVSAATTTATLGQPISDQATLSDGQNPTGSITFRAFGPDDATCSNAAAYTSAAVTVSGNATYTNSPTFTPTAAGTYRWIASYSGDANNDAAQGACNDPDETSVVSAPPVQPTPPGGGALPASAVSCGGTQATIVGTTGPDKLRGTKGLDVIQALGGNDKVKGLGANDIVCGGRGNDTLRGGAGADTLIGGAGKDLLLGGSDLDRLFGGSVGATISGAAVDRCPGSDEDRRHGCRAS